MHKLRKRVKYKGNFYRVGDKIKINKEDLAEFEKRGLINVHREEFKDKPIQEHSKEVKLNVGDSGASERDLTVPEIKVLLDNQGIEYSNSMKKAELLELLGRD